MANYTFSIPTDCTCKHLRPVWGGEITGDALSNVVFQGLSHEGHCPHRLTLTKPSTTEPTELDTLRSQIASLEADNKRMSALLKYIQGKRDDETKALRALAKTWGDEATNLEKEAFQSVHERNKFAEALKLRGQSAAITAIVGKE